MTPEQWERIEFYRPSEFDSPDDPGSGRGMEFGFIQRLDRLRGMMHRSLTINSGHRTAAHNLKVGGKPNSAHLRWSAADIEAKGLEDAIRMALLAAMLGIPRVGVSLSGKFVHLDNDTSLPWPAIWFYA